MAHKVLYEEQTLISRESGEVIILDESFKFDNKTMLIVTSNCMVFDKDWNRIDLACEFLRNRLDVKQQELNTVEAKCNAVKLVP